MRVPLDGHRDVKHASDGRAVGGRIHVHNQAVRPNAKDAERGFERLRAKRVSAQVFGNSPRLFQVALGNVAAAWQQGKT